MDLEDYVTNAPFYISINVISLVKLKLATKDKHHVASPQVQIPKLSISWVGFCKVMHKIWYYIVQRIKITILAEQLLLLFVSVKFPPS